ncbi:unnamed protein product [Cuscuta europaea]|uniref:BAHD acyltransferase n=1 Tax=Cuscuta europaea TaxID=41803 RepID=A0A9P0ZEZ3_CUSEU|nr:unnamed protein product [Cuscuta europaea]
MALKVEVYEKENVKPFIPTPESLNAYKLSLLDQIAGTFYMPVVFFYAHSAASPHHDYERLKLSLSKALSSCYPLAGRQKDEFTVVCNDAGADFFRANVTNRDMCELLGHPRLDLLRQLFPRDPYPTDFDPSQPLLAVQVNRFRCGGTAVAICLWHALADGSGLLGLLQTWSRFNRGEGPAADASANHHEGSFVVDPTLIFPPVNFEIPAVISSEAARRRRVSGTYIGKRFVFAKKEIERIKDEMQMIPPCFGRPRPTRVEALSAFIWAAVIRATLRVTPNLKTHLLTNVVDLRRRMDPPFPPTCLGNINQITDAKWAADAGAGAITGQSVIGSVREAIVKVNDGYVRKMHGGGGYLRQIIEARKVKDSSGSNMKEEEKEERLLYMSTWFKFGCLKVDFGWGKPRWLGPGNSLGDLALLLDAEDGGIEVWVGLPKPIMNHVDQDLDFTSHVAFSQIIWNPSELQQLLSSRL